MKTIAAALLALSCAPCSASVTNTTTAGCPVNLDRVHFRHRYSDGDYTPLTLRYINQNPSTIIGIKFDVSLMDSTGDFTSLGTVDSAEKVRMGQGSVYFSEKLLTLNRYVGFRITVTKIAFEDGTKWEDDGTNKCMYAEDPRTK